MNDISINFLKLKQQTQIKTIYRKIIENSSLSKAENDFRVKLPKKDSDDKWCLFDISTSEKDDYEPYEYKFSTNWILSIYLIYSDFLQLLGAANRDIDYYTPEKAISFKEVRFVTERFDDGATEIIAKPYHLKSKNQFGFLLNHKYSLNEGENFNRQTQIRSLSLDKSGKPNIYFYKDKKAIIETFANDILSPLLSSSPLEIKTAFERLPAEQLDVKTYLVGGENKANSQFIGIKSHGPYRPMEDNVRYLFLFTERTRSLARDIYLGLLGKLFPGQFSGLKDMFSVPIHKDIVEHHLVETFDAKAIAVVETKIQHLKAQYPDDKIMLVSVLPKGFKGVDAAFDAYGHLKLMALRTGAYCQVITEDTFFKRDQLKWSVSNIGLQTFSKLGGAPWLVQPAKNNCLIFGIGSVQEEIDDSIVRYTAYTVCLDTSGDFKYIKPLSSFEDETTYLKNLKTNLFQVLSSELGDQYRSLVLHLPYKISLNEIDVIKEVVGQVRREDEFEVIVVRINTQHKFFGFSDHNTCVPYESSYVQLSKNEFLIWAEGLQYGKKVLHKRVSEPLYVDFIESREEWATKKDCLQDILNLTGANWRGFNSKAQPISILYSRLIAEFMKKFSHLENVNDMSIVSAESVAPWFL